MRDRTKEIIKDGFGSLVSNASAMRGAKAGPLWLTIVFFVLALILPVIPLFVAQANTNGSTFLNTYSYGLEKYVTSIAIDLNNDGFKFGIDSNHLLSITKDDAAIDFSKYESETPFANYENEATHQYDFLVYLSSAKTEKQKNELVKAIGTKTYRIDSTEAFTESGAYHPSYMVLFEDGVYVCIYASNTNKAIAASYLGDFKTIKENNDCLSTILSVKDKDGNFIAQSLINNDYVNGVYKNFKTFLNKSYETLKIRNMWGTSGIYLAVFFGLNVLMGFLMWLLTRGKNNPNNYFTPWLTMKIQARLGLSPAIITLVAGFFLTQYAPVIYIVTVGLRVMWMSMKELRPIQ